MRALVLEQGRLSYRGDMPVPEPAAGHALIRVQHAGICATDLQIINGLYDFDGILGHEFIGRVEAVNTGAESTGLVGSLVAGEINLACHACDMCDAGLYKHCRKRRVLGIRKWNGAFADYLTLPIENLHALPENLPRDALVLLEPLAAVTDILDKVDVQSDTRVAIVGDGRIGQLAARVLAANTNSLLMIGRHSEKLDRLPAGVSGQKTAETGQLRSFDVVVECSGASSGFFTALGLTKPGGTIVLKSTYAEPLAIDGSQLVVNEINVIGSRCGNFERALEFVQSGQEKDQDLASLVDAHFELEAGLDALAHARGKHVIKVVLDMDQT